jgi:hypothetical protein
MTVVRVLVQTPVDGGEAPAVGGLRWTPTARRVAPAEGAVPAAVVLPAGFAAVLVDGAVDVEVEPTTSAWFWSVVESFIGSPARRRVFAVPDVATVDYADLVEIDPATLTPAPSPDPAWLAPLTELESRVDAVTVTPDPANPGFYLIGA